MCLLHSVPFSCRNGDDQNSQIPTQYNTVYAALIPEVYQVTWVRRAQSRPKTECRNLIRGPSAIEDYDRFVREIKLPERWPVQTKQVSCGFHPTNAVARFEGSV